MGRRVIVTYLITLAGCSLLAGWLLNRMLTAVAVVEHVEKHSAGAGYIEQLCALVLVGLLIAAILPRKTKTCCHCH
jgi:uncharacterized membrane protein